MFRSACLARLLASTLALFAAVAVAGTPSGARLSGTLQDAQGTPLANVQVLVQQQYGSSQVLMTDVDGRYDTGETLAAGAYSVRTLDYAQWINELWPDTPCPISCTEGDVNWIVLDPGEAFVADFSLEPGAGLSGRLIETGGGLGVMGTVQVYDAAGVYQTTIGTDAAGNFVLPQVLPAGDYRLLALSEGLVPTLYPNLPCPGFFGCDPLLSQAVPLTAGQTRADTNLLLAPGGRLAGTVSAEVGGQGLPGQGVVLYSADGQLLDVTSSQGDGSFSFFYGLPPGDYRIVASGTAGYLGLVYPELDCMHDCDPLQGALVPVSGTGTVALDLRLAAGARLSGIALEPDGVTPVPGVFIYVVDAEGNPAAASLTGPDGRYQTGTALLPGTYFAMAEATGPYLRQYYDQLHCPPVCSAPEATPIVVDFGDLRDDIDFPLLEGGRIEGAVTRADDGTPLQGVTVVALSEQSGLVAAQTDANGRYSLGGLAVGTYRVVALGTAGLVTQRYPGIDCPADACPEDPASAVDVALGQAVQDIDFALAAGARVAGSVIDRGTALPLPNITIVIESENRELSFSTTTDANGEFQTDEGLLAGRYRVYTGNNAGYIDQMYPQLDCEGVCYPAEAGLLELGTGELRSDIDFDLTPGARLAGVVSAADGGAPIPFVTLRLLLPDGRVVATGRSALDGSYQTRQAVPAGTYHLGTRNLQGYVDLAWPDVPCSSCTPPRGAPIEVAAPGTLEDFDFQLAVGSIISGQILDMRSGAPLPGISVTVRDAEGARLAGGTSDETGAFATLQGLPTGSYTLSTVNLDGYRNVVWPDVPCYGACDHALGTPIAVTAPAPVADIVIELDTWPIFADRFE